MTNNDRDIFIWDTKKVNPQLVTTIRGTFSDLSIHGEYLATDKGIYDMLGHPTMMVATDTLDSQIQDIEENIPYSFSEDGKYLLQKNGDYTDSIKLDLLKNGTHKEIENNILLGQNQNKYNIEVSLLDNRHILLERGGEVIMELKAIKGDIEHYSFKAGGEAIEIISEYIIDDSNGNWAGLYVICQYYTELIWLKGLDETLVIFLLEWIKL